MTTEFNEEDKLKGMDEANVALENIRKIPTGSVETDTPPSLNRRAMDDKSNFKSILQSKTFWVNLIALVGFIVQQKFGFVIDETIQAQILMVVNVGLRMITNEPVNWTPTIRKGNRNGTV